MTLAYWRAKKLMERADKLKSAAFDNGRFNKAIKVYNKAINLLDEDNKDQSYYKAQVFKKMAFCYEEIGDIENRNLVFDKAAKNFEKIGYEGAAKQLRELKGCI